MKKSQKRAKKTRKSKKRIIRDKKSSRPCGTRPLGKEDRKHKRIKTLIPITVRVTRVGDSKEDFYFTKDLSLGGVFLKTRQDISVGTVIDMELSIQGVRDLIKVRGKVVRVGRSRGKKEGIGVQFVKIDDESRLGLKTFLKE